MSYCRSPIYLYAGKDSEGFWYLCCTHCNPSYMYLSRKITMSELDMKAYHHMVRHIDIFKHSGQDEKADLLYLRLIHNLLWSHWPLYVKMVSAIEEELEMNTKIRKGVYMLKEERD